MSAEDWEKRIEALPRPPMAWEAEDEEREDGPCYPWNGWEVAQAQQALDARYLLLRQMLGELQRLNEALEVIDRVKQYPDPDPAARARRVIAYLKNEALLERKRADRT